MSFKIILFLLIFQITLQNKSWGVELYIKNIEVLIKRIKSYLNEDIFKTKEYFECKNEFENIFNDKEKSKQLVEYSSISIPDRGNEENCVVNNTYLLTLIKFKYKNISEDNITPLHAFLHYDYLYFGLCLPNKCLTIYKMIISNTTDKNNITTKSLDVSNMTISYYVNNKLKTRKTDDKYYTFLVIGIILIIYASIKLVVQIILHFYKDKFEMEDEDEERTILTSNFENILGENMDEDGTNILNVEEENEEKIKRREKRSRSGIEKNNRSLNPNLNQKKRNSLMLSGAITLNSNNSYQYSGLSSVEMSKVIKNKKLYIIDLIFSYSENIRIMVKKNNLLFSSKNLSMIYFFQTINLLCMTISHHFWSIIKIPSKESGNIVFFQSLFFFFIKIVSFSNTAFIVLESFIFSYKLMSYIKKYYLSGNHSQKIKKRFPFKKLFQFYIYFIPKLFIFFISIGFVFSIQYIYSKSTIFEFIHENLLTNRWCLKHPLNLFIPFSFEYNEFYPPEERTQTFRVCFKYIYCLRNFFYSYTFAFIIIYISLTLKSMLFDSFTILLLIINFIFCLWSSYPIRDNSLTCSMYLDHMDYLKYPHMFISIYMIGFLTGICYFYYKDVISSSSIEAIPIYKPFHFCFTIITILDKLNVIFKFLLILFLASIITLMSFALSIFKKIYPTKGDILIKVPNKISIIEIFYILETHLFSIIYCFLILMITIYPKDTFFKHICSFRIFIFFSRFGISYYSILDQIVYIFYGLNNFRIQMNYLNFFLTSLGLFIYTQIFNCIIAILIEIPIKVIIKYYKIIDFKNKKNI